MGAILIHAGMPKTGSTSIQSWLRVHADLLRDELGVTILRQPRDESHETLRLDVFDSGGPPTYSTFSIRYLAGLRQGRSQQELRALVMSFLDELDRAASGLGAVLLTSETFTTFLVRVERPFLEGLEELGRRHAVRVACYVRPQHSALEARWRQWGFRTDKRPSVWVREEAERLRYCETLEQVGGIAPSIALEMRPFRRDLLDNGNVVVDFARRFLAIDAPPDAGEFHDNPGPPLDLANLLRGAPAELLETHNRGRSGRIETGVRLRDLGRLARSWSIPESTGAHRSREVLQAFAHQQLEPSNRRLITRLGWPTESFVPAPDPPAADATTAVAELDRLWGGREHDIANSYLHAALGELFRRADAPPGGVRK